MSFFPQCAPVDLPLDVLPRLPVQDEDAHQVYGQVVAGGARRHLATKPPLSVAQSCKNPRTPEMF